MRTVIRNSFARNTIIARRVHDVSTTCKWCGNRRTTRNGRPWLYQFSQENDGLLNTLHAIPGLFCSRSCAETYHGASFDETR